MNELTLLLTLALIHLLALMSPGPDFALVVQKTTRLGRVAGFYIALGLSLGILLHTLLSLAGLSLLVQQQPSVMAVVQWVGGGYLLYLGLSALRTTYLSWHQSSLILSVIDQSQSLSRWQTLLQGLLTNLLNPKALVFFVSLISGLVPATMSLTGKLSAAALLFLLSMGWFCLLAWLLSSVFMQQRLAYLGRYIDGVCGLVFTLLGSGLLLNQIVWRDQLLFSACQILVEGVV